MKANRAQRTTLSITFFLLVLLALFPPWQQAAEKELDYRKDLGRAFILDPPRTIPVDCYFVGCKTAPASYFHALVYRTLLLSQVATVASVGLLVMWILRTRRDNLPTGFASKGTRLAFSFVLALAIPPTGTFPFGAMVASIPSRLNELGEMGLLPLVFEAIAYFLAVLLVYGSVSGLVWVARRRSTNRFSE